MSGYGPPGPYQGQPQDPWQGGAAASRTPMASRTHMVRRLDSMGSLIPTVSSRILTASHRSGVSSRSRVAPTGATTRRRGTYQQPAYGQPPGPGPGREPVGARRPHRRRRKGSGGTVALVIVLVLLLCGGGAAGIWYVLKDNKTTPTTTSPTPKASTSAKSSGERRAERAGSSAPAGVQAGDAKTVKVGECLDNQGTAQQPRMVKTTCAPATFEVLKRIDGTVGRKSKCDGSDRLHA